MAKEFFTKDQYNEAKADKPIRTNFKDLTGKRVDKLKVIDYAGLIGKYHFWWCQCDCDNNKYFRVNDSSIKKNLTGSCGCNYKKNGGWDIDPIENASNNLNGSLVFLDFSGWNSPYKVRCNECGKSYSGIKANNFRSKTCCESENINTDDLNTTSIKTESYKKVKQEKFNRNKIIKESEDKLSYEEIFKIKTLYSICGEINKAMKWDRDRHQLSLEVDHAISLKEGGTHSFDNLQILTKRHNSSKNSSSLPKMCYDQQESYILSKVSAEDYLPYYEEALLVVNIELCKLKHITRSM